MSRFLRIKQFFSFPFRISCVSLRIILSYTNIIYFLNFLPDFHLFQWYFCRHLFQLQLLLKCLKLTILHISSRLSFPALSPYTIIFSNFINSVTSSSNISSSNFLLFSILSSFLKQIFVVSLIAMNIFNQQSGCYGYILVLNSWKNY